MIFKKLELPGAYIIDLEKRSDERGFFARGWCQNEAKAAGLHISIAQVNISFNDKKGTLRGLHYQKAPHAEIKVVRCTKGSIFDVMVDIRPNSPTFKQWFGTELNEENHRMLYVPEGFAHGYLTLEDKSEVYYLTSEFYMPDYEAGLHWNDHSINIEWPFVPQIVSDKDKNQPLLE